MQNLSLFDRFRIPKSIQILWFCNTKSMRFLTWIFVHFFNDFGLHFGGQKSLKNWKFEVPRRLWSQLGHSFTFSAKFEVPETHFSGILRYFGTKNWRCLRYLDIIFHKFRNPLTSKSCLPNLRSLKLDFWLFWNTLALKIKDFAIFGHHVSQSLQPFDVEELRIWLGRRIADQYIYM